MLPGAPSCFYKLYSMSTVVTFAKEKIYLNLLARLSVSALVRFAQHSAPMYACALLAVAVKARGESAAAPGVRTYGRRIRAILA